MRKLSRKLFIACLAVAFAVIALGTSTYAWLVVSKTASVDSFSAEVTAGAGSLQVSLDEDGTYGPNIASSELTQFTTGVKFKDLTLNSNDNKFYTISADTDNNDATLIEAGEASALKGQSIVQFDFWVKLDNTAAAGTTKKLQLDLAKTTITPGAEAYSWTPEYDVTSQKADFALIKGTETTKYFASNAARIMIKLGDNNPVIVENNVNTGLQDNNATDGAMGYLKKSLGKETSATITANSANSQDATHQLGNGFADLGEVSQTATKVTVTVWIEGFDFDCINAIYKQTLAATLGLTVTDIQ